jgi:hypothetical protein
MMKMPDLLYLTISVCRECELLRLEFLTALKMRITVLWNVRKHSGSASHMKMETADFIQMLVILVETSKSIALISPTESNSLLNMFSKNMHFYQRNIS